MNFHKFNKVPTLENLNPPPRYSGPPPSYTIFEKWVGDSYYAPRLFGTPE